MISTQGAVPPHTHTFIPRAMKTVAVAVVALCALMLHTVNAAEAGKVEVGYYMESLCPDCIQFSTTTLRKAIEGGLLDIMDLKIFPYGNARGTGSHITCQHGQQECKGNLLETCLISMNPKVETFWPAFECMDLRRDPVGDAESCINKYNLNYTSVLDCATRWVMWGKSRGACALTSVCVCLCSASKVSTTNPRWPKPHKTSLRRTPSSPG